MRRDHRDTRYHPALRHNPVTPSQDKRQTRRSQPEGGISGEILAASDQFKSSSRSNSTAQSFSSTRSQGTQTDAQTDANHPTTPEDDRTEGESQDK